MKLFRVRYFRFGHQWCLHHPSKAQKLVLTQFEKHNQKDYRVHEGKIVDRHNDSVDAYRVIGGCHAVVFAHSASQACELVHKTLKIAKDHIEHEFVETLDTSKPVIIEEYEPSAD